MKTWLTKHEMSLGRVFKAVTERVRQYPAPLDQLGLSYAAKFDVGQEGSSKNYVCYLLPYWMEDVGELPSETQDKLAIANIFIMLYYFIQDDIMDSSKGEHREKLPLANLFQLDYMAIYRELFPASSPFWNYFDTYVQEWADSVTNEGSRDDFHGDKLRIARKASPVKNASTGTLLLTGQAHFIPEVTAAVELALVTLQMLDDYADWEEDLEEGSYNCLLASIRRKLGLMPADELSVEAIKQQIFVLDHLDAYHEVAAAHHEELIHKPARMEQLYKFHHSLVHNLENIAQEIKEQRKLLISGGFFHFMSKSV
ncbi:class 1 isoprenoid biosynthesis enzyme [Paenibacillus whitsoniae]|uniref:Class 1 isoprenoid biosynthesis enzyme n=1 Tax=Paenibacillus whitsoniae TaxID=2496558 RepID=A0A3S0BVJ9_9BACL|nr:class 1 isoprenoid biosynthesis enzyme [Paenibacillus whitsoniae]RTE09336.1 class 1 isoprenoid biosynthesis enzyme [Paenibacillus whitsoniae]